MCDSEKKFEIQKENVRFRQKNVRFREKMCDSEGKCAIQGENVRFREKIVRFRRKMCDSEGKCEIQRENIRFRGGRYDSVGKRTIQRKERSCTFLLTIEVVFLLYMEVVLFFLFCMEVVLFCLTPYRAKKYAELYIRGFLLYLVVVELVQWYDVRIVHRTL